MTWAMDELEARAAVQLGRLRDFGEAMSSIRVRESDSDDVISVEVDGNGALVGLWMTDGANELGATGLGERIASVALIAAQRAFAQRAALTEEFTAEFGELMAQ